MSHVRWATEKELSDSGALSIAQTPEGDPAFWGAVVTCEGESNIPDEMIILGKPRDAEEGTAHQVTFAGRSLRTNLADSTRGWRRAGEQIVILRHGMSYATLPEEGENG